MVEAVGPEVFEEGVGGFFGAGDGEAAADDVLAGDFGDTAGEGVEAPGVEALLLEFFAGVLVAVEIGGVEGCGADEEFGFGFVELNPFRSLWGEAFSLFANAKSIARCGLSPLALNTFQALEEGHSVRSDASWI